MKPKSVLIIRLSAMGDVAMTSPIVHELCQQYPDVQFTFLSTGFFKPFFQSHPNFRFEGTDIKKSGKGIKGIWDLFRTLKAVNEFDCVVDLHDVLRTKVLRTFFWLSGCRVVTICKGRREKKQLTRKNNKIVRQLKPTVERYSDAFRQAGLELIGTGAVPFGKAVLGDEIVAITGPKNEKWVGIAPFAQHKGKIYPIERMEEVVSKLNERGDIRMFVFGGGAKERDVAQSLATKYKNCQSAIGLFSLQQEMDLISNLDVMVSMDSSAMHMASLFGVRVVSVWCATHPYAGFLGYGQSMDDCVQLDLDCRPCSIYGNKPCYKGTWECQDIPPQTIVDKVLG